MDSFRLFALSDVSPHTEGGKLFVLDCNIGFKWTLKNFFPLPSTRNGEGDIPGTIYGR